MESLWYHRHSLSLLVRCSTVPVTARASKIRRQGPLRVTSSGLALNKKILALRGCPACNTMLEEAIAGCRRDGHKVYMPFATNLWAVKRYDFLTTLSCGFSERGEVLDELLGEEEKEGRRESQIVVHLEVRRESRIVAPPSGSEKENGRRSLGGGPPPPPLLPSSKNYNSSPICVPLPCFFRAVRGGRGLELLPLQGRETSPRPRQFFQT